MIIPESDSLLALFCSVGGRERRGGSVNAAHKPNWYLSTSADGAAPQLASRLLPLLLCLCCPVGAQPVSLRHFVSEACTSHKNSGYMLRWGHAP